MMKCWHAAAAFLLVALIASLPGPAISQDRSAKKELVIGYSDEAQALDPRKWRINPDRMVAQLIYSPLIYNSQKGIIPVLAEKWETPNLTTYVFRLRRGVKFHNGEELTSADVKFTYDWILDARNGSPFRPLVQAVTNVRAVDKYTVRFDLREPQAQFLSSLDIGIVPKQYAEANPDDPNLKPVGTGPFQFVEWLPHQRIVLKAFKQYFEGAPKLEQITFIPITNSAVRILQLETGQIDVAYIIPTREVQRAKREGKFNVIESPASAATFISLNVARKPLDDVRVRRAIKFATNRKEISEVAYFGLTTPGASPILPSSPFYEPNVEHFPYDPAKAKALLREAGYSDGVSLELELLPGGLSYGEVLQAQWGRAGITLSFKVREAATIIRDFNTANYHMITFGLGVTPDPDQLLFPRFHSSQRPPTGLNAGYSNPKVDSLLEEARRSTDFQKRKQLYSEVQKALVSEVPYMILVYRPEFAIATKRLCDVTFAPFIFFFDTAKKAYWCR